MILYAGPSGFPGTRPRTISAPYIRLKTSSRVDNLAYWVVVDRELPKVSEAATPGDVGSRCSNRSRMLRTTGTDDRSSGAKPPWVGLPRFNGSLWRCDLASGMAPSARPRDLARGDDLRPARFSGGRCRCPATIGADR